MEILHIANTNASDEIVLNDEFLLQLVIRYPFLYDSTSPAYKDPDYEEWAWKAIVDRFNRAYQSKNITFTVAMLQERWQSLQPLIIGLSQTDELSCISVMLSDMIQNLSTHLTKAKKEQPPKKALTYGQELIINEIETAKRLPLNLRIAMETEIMGLLLQADLIPRAVPEESLPRDNNKLQTELNEFVQMFRSCRPAKTSSKKNGETAKHKKKDTAPDADTSKTNTPDIIDLGSETSKSSCFVNEESPEIIVPDVVGELPTVDCVEDSKYDIPRVVNEPILNDDVMDSTKLNDEDIKFNLSDYPLQIASVESVSMRFVPLKDAPNYARRCVVRLKRFNMEDYVPLSKIKRECRM